MFSPSFITTGQGPTIGFEQSTYVFEEGTTGEVCVTVDLSLDDSTTAVAILFYIPMSASMLV
jgi:hypothetical protein